VASRCSNALSPPTNEDDQSIVVEFDNRVFHYPTQPSTKGLMGASFKTKLGTTTAIGPTRAGKRTTISRSFFRFYDPLRGVIKNDFDF
jgi:ABC-type multidrug transport system fused ATPase/permease subunit